MSELKKPTVLLGSMNLRNPLRLAVRIDEHGALAYTIDTHENSHAGVLVSSVAIEREDAQILLTLAGVR